MLDGLIMYCQIIVYVPFLIQGTMQVDDQGETEWRHNEWGRVSFANSTVVATGCSACDFHVSKLQPIKLSKIC